MNRRMLAMIGSLLLASGCGGSDEDRVKLVPVSGTVTLDGKPLEGANIAFIPDAGNEKPQTDGGDVTGPGGTFEAKYRNRGGLAPGKYKVTVARPGDGPGGAGAGKGMHEDIAKSSYMAGLSAKPDPKASAKKAAAAAPWPYGDAASTPLKHEVSSGGDKDLKFDLKSTAK